MTLYEIKVKATNHGFCMEKKTYSGCINEHLVHYTEGFFDISFPVSRLDQILLGKLYRYDPELPIYTFREETIEDRIDEMKDIILTYLKKRLEYIDYLIDLCK